MAEAPFIELRGIEKRFGDHVVLRGLHLEVARGEKVVLIGRSGSGKSTVLRLLMGLDRPDRGVLRIDGNVLWPSRDGRPASHEPAQAVRSKVGMVFQHFNLFPHLNALRNVALAPELVQRKPRADAEEHAHHWLAQVGLGDRAEAMPWQLSGGQKQRVAIARALALQPAVMLFDEVTSGLDPELVAEVLLVMQRLAETDMTLLIVTHQIGFASQIADSIAMVHDGRIVEQGPPQALLSAPADAATRRFLRAAAGMGA